MSNYWCFFKKFAEVVLIQNFFMWSVISIVALSVNTWNVLGLNLYIGLFQSLLDDEFFYIFLSIVEQRGWTISRWLWLFSVLLKLNGRLDISFVVLWGVIFNKLHNIMLILTVTFIVTRLEHHAEIIVLHRLNVSQVFFFVLFLKFFTLC